MTWQIVVCNDTIVFLSVLPRDDHVIISSSSRHHRQKGKRCIDVVHGATRIIDAHRQRHESERNTTIRRKSSRLEKEKSNESGNNDDEVVSSQVVIVSKLYWTQKRHPSCYFELMDSITLDNMILIWCLTWTSVRLSVNWINIKLTAI